MKQEEPTGQKVLIVDDETVNIKILSDLVKGLAKVLFATNGEDAIKAANSHSPDLILLDVMMPGMNGYEVCKRLKENTSTESIPVVFVTSMSAEEDEATGLELGAIDYITKPFHSSIVKMRIKNHLEMKRQRETLERLSEELTIEVNQLIEAEKKITHLATHDNLTGLPNRMLFMDRLELAVSNAERSQSVVSVMFIDLDGFKEVNDTLGHDFGDLVLKGVAEKLTGCVRKTDTVARLGGDEFIILLVDVKGHDEIDRIAAKILSAVSDPLQNNGQKGNIKASIGISFFPENGESPAQLIKMADEAMYQVKASGKNNYSFAGM